MAWHKKLRPFIMDPFHARFVYSVAAGDLATQGAVASAAMAVS